MKFYLCTIVVLTGTVLVPVLPDEVVNNITGVKIANPAVDTESEILPRTGIVNTNICGGVLTSSSSTISYKNATFISPNERCIWIIRPNNATTFTVNVTSFGLQIQPGQTGITATCFNRIGAPAPTSVVIRRAGSVSVASTCHSLVMTFYSGENVGTSRGFSVSYTTRIGTTGAAITSKSYIFGGGPQQIRHPANADLQYTNLELTIFGFPPRFNVFSTSTKTLVTYMRDSLENTSCYDQVQLYRFTPVSGWSVSETVCGNVEFKQWEDNDVMLLTFTSDTSVVGRGFHVVRSILPL